jgi:hypothetical protein
MNRLIYRVFGPVTSRRNALFWMMVGVLLHQLSKETPDWGSAFDWAYISTAALSCHWLGMRLNGYRG